MRRLIHEADSRGRHFALEDAWTDNLTVIRRDKGTAVFNAMETLKHRTVVLF